MELAQWKAVILTEFISELLNTKEMLVVINSAGAVSEMDTAQVGELEFLDEWATIESHGWHGAEFRGSLT